MPLTMFTSTQDFQPIGVIAYIGEEDRAPEKIGWVDSMN